MKKLIIEISDHINTDIDQIEVWAEWLKDLKDDEKYIGLIETMDKEIKLKKEYLLKLNTWSLPDTKDDLEISRIEGILLGLKICKEMWAQGTISHENIYENEVIYKEELELLKKGYN